MRPNGLVPSVLVFGTLPKFLCTTSIKRNQLERYEANNIARTEMETIVAESRIKRALQSELRPAKKHLMLPGDLVMVYRERNTM